MAKVSVSIYIRKSGIRAYELASPRKAHVGAIFVLRYKQRGKRVWQTPDDVHSYDQAKVQANKKRIELLVEQANIEMGVLPAVEAKPVPPPHPPLSDLKERFLEFKRTTCKKDGTPLDEETVDAYEQQVTEFLKACQHEYPGGRGRDGPAPLHGGSAQARPNASVGL
jgi:hypothetical protein